MKEDWEQGKAQLPFAFIFHIKTAVPCSYFECKLGLHVLKQMCLTRSCVVMPSALLDAVNDPWICRSQEKFVRHKGDFM